METVIMIVTNLTLLLKVAATITSFLCLLSAISDNENELKDLARSLHLPDDASRLLVEEIGERKDSELWRRYKESRDYNLKMFGKVLVFSAICWIVVILLPTRDQIERIYGVSPSVVETPEKATKEVEAK